MKPRTILLLIGIAVFTVVLGLSFSGSASLYTDFKSARESGDKVHIVGEWVNRESSSYDPASDKFSFFLKDTLGNISPVVYHDPKPMNFETAEKVLVIGQYPKGADAQTAFDAEQIVMKCPSKYETKEITVTAQ